MAEHDAKVRKVLYAKEKEIVEYDSYQSGKKRALDLTAQK